MVESNLTTEKIEAWSNRHNILFQGHNVRPYGSYELMISVDQGQNWTLLPQVAGAKISTFEAFEMFLTNVAGDVNVIEQVKSLIGEDKYNDLFDIKLLEETVDVNNTE